MKILQVLKEAKETIDEFQKTLELRQGHVDPDAERTLAKIETTIKNFKAEKETVLDDFMEFLEASGVNFVDEQGERMNKELILELYDGIGGTK